MTTHSYSLHGLTIDSAIACPALASGNGPVEVEFRYGEVPEEIPDAMKRGVLYQAAPGRFLLAIDGVAKYLVADGREIVVEPAVDADERSVRVFLLGSAMGALLHQRRFLPLHASAIENDGGAIAFVGHSGQGKSTLAAAFHQAGYRVLADDICAVMVEDGGVPKVYPAYPELRLWADAIEKLKIDPEGLARTRPELEKSCLPTGEGLEQEPLPISHVYVLATTNRDELELVPIEGMRKLEVLSRYTYGWQFLDGLVDKKDHFTLCVAVSRRARMAWVVRPGAGFQLEELRERVEEDFLAVGIAG